MRRKLAAGNWKMNGLRADLAELTALAEASPTPSCDVLICPPATLVAEAADRMRGTSVMIGAQDCHVAESGAHTGDVSAAMLADAGASHVIVGHSERRTDHRETDDRVRAKANAGLAAGLTPIVCLGESLAERESGRTLEIIGGQLEGSLPEGSEFVVAYEPVWAIGTGKVATLGQIEEVHGFLRTRLAELLGTQAADAIPLLYGGSVKAANAAEIFGVDNVDGALVGGASLKAADFAPIVEALGAS